MSQFSILDFITLLATAASLVLAVVAIWLSIVFYRLSNDASKSIGDSSKQIGASVDRLEKLFDKLYSDTFSMMKETVTDMRQHVWKTPSEKAKNDEIDEVIKKQIKNEVQQIVDRQQGTEVKVDKLAKDLEGVLEKAIRHKKEVKGEELRRSILVLIPRIESPTLEKLKAMLKASENDIADTIFDLRQDGIVTWDGIKKGILTSSDIIRLVKK